MNRNTCNFNDQSSYLWCILYYHFVQNSIDDANRLIAAMYEQKFELSLSVEKLLLTLWESGEAPGFIDLAREAVEQMLLDIDKHVYVVAKLVNLKAISISEAEKLLSTVTTRDYNELDSRVRKVIDVAWLVSEDSSGRFMSPDDDSALVDALMEVSTLFDST